MGDAMMACSHSVEYLYCTLDQEPGCIRCNEIEYTSNERARLIGKRVDVEGVGIGVISDINESATTAAVVLDGARVVFVKVNDLEGVSNE